MFNTWSKATMTKINKDILFKINFKVIFAKGLKNFVIHFSSSTPKYIDPLKTLRLLPCHETLRVPINAGMLKSLLLLKFIFY